MGRTDAIRGLKIEILGHASARKDTPSGELLAVMRGGSHVLCPGYGGAAKSPLGQHCA
jgi:hypothetical protein